MPGLTLSALVLLLVLGRVQVGASSPPSPAQAFHHKLSKRELVHTFGIERAEHVPDYQLMEARRGQLPDGTRTVEFAAWNTSYRLALRPNLKLLSPHLVSTPYRYRMPDLRGARRQPDGALPGTAPRRGALPLPGPRAERQAAPGGHLGLRQAAGRDRDRRPLPHDPDRARAPARRARECLGESQCHLPAFRSRTWSTSASRAC